MVNVMLVFAFLLVLSLSSFGHAGRVRPSSAEYAQFFTRWLSSRNTTYTADVFQRRFNTYKANFDLVEDHNERFRSGLESFTMALNQWADLSESEYRAKLGFVDHSSDNQPLLSSRSSPVIVGDPISDAMCKRFGIMCARSSSSSSSSSTGPASSSSAPSRPSSSSSSGVAAVIPSSTAAAGGSRSSSTGAPAPGSTNVDWRQYGYIGPVKDQGQCGSCWTFASTAVAEAAWAMKTGTLLSFSEQELLDCAANGARTCATGGAMQDSWNWWIGSGSTRRSPMTGAAYPYTTNSDASCLYDASRATNAVFATKVNVQPTEAALLAASQARPAVAVAVHASGRAFQFYSSGVLSDSTCLSTNLDHAVVVVGYGTDATTGYDYYLVRNSWGTGWGDRGYAKIRRNFNNMCGITTQPSYVTA